MVAKKNLLGMKFGSLTVIKSAGSNHEGRALWLCLCDCGEERIAVGKDLGKKITMCPKKCVLTEDLTGRRIGNLLVLQQEGSDKHGCRRYRCRCITPLNDIANDREDHPIIPQEGLCGKEFLVNGLALKQFIKKADQRQIPKCCFPCSRILHGKKRRERKPMEDLSGQTFGRLTAIRRIYRGSGTYKRPMYECNCDCGSGQVTCVRQEALIGKSAEPIRSCGCLQREAASKNKTNLIHGMSKHPLYKLRANMIKRCYDTKASAYSRYGGRGIKICDIWFVDFMTFYSWAMERGWTSGQEIDRIDNDGPYSPDNCQILTKKANILKMHLDHGKAFLIGNKQININELSENAHVSADLCRKLLSNGYSEDDVFSYGRLELHQKNAVGRSIRKCRPITIAEASEKERVSRIKTPQTSEVGSYRAMMARCYNPNDHSYRNYGAKGVEVCARWKGNPTQFLHDMGPKPEPKRKHVLDRIDPKKGYYPENCRWLIDVENSRRVSQNR